MIAQYHSHTYEGAQGKIFGLSKTGVVSRSSVIKIIAVLGIFIGIGLTIRHNNTSQDQIKQYQALQVFSKIDDLGHEGINDLWKRWYYNTGDIEAFQKIDLKFHETIVFSKKYALAKQMDVLMEKIDVYIHKIGKITTPESIAKDKRYHELDTLFNQLK